MTPFASALLTVVLLAANAFFVGAEFALISARRTRVEPLATSGSRPARITLFAMGHVSLMMAGAQLGITVCSLALGAVAEPMIAATIEIPLHAVGVPDSWLHPIALVIALSLVTYLHVVLGEMVPKNIAIAGPERLAMALSPVLVALVTLLLPLLWVLNGLANLVLRLIRVTPRDEVASAFTGDEVADLVAESRRSGLIDRDDERLVLGALTFTERDVRSVLIPMGRVATLDESLPVADAAAAAARLGFSRFPVRDATGAPCGYIHIKDLRVEDPDRRGRRLGTQVVRPLPQVAATDSLRTALQVMQRAKAHLALVTGPGADAATDGAADGAAEPIGAAGNGGGRAGARAGSHEGAATTPLGVVTLEDVLEELIGTVLDDSRSPASE